MASFNYVTSTGTSGTCGTFTTGTITMPAVSSAGDFILFAGGYGTSFINAVTDNYNNSWAQYVTAAPLQVYYTINTNTGTSTMTITFTSSGTGGTAAIRNAVVSEYTLPNNYVMVPSALGQYITTNTAQKFIITQYLQGTYSTNTEILAVVAAANTNTGSTWTVNTGNIRGTFGTGSLSTIIADADVVVTTAGQVGFGWIGTNTTTGTRLFSYFQFLAQTTNVNGPAFENTWDGGMVG